MANCHWLECDKMRVRQIVMLLCLFIVAIRNKARGFEEQNNIVRWSSYQTATSKVIKQFWSMLSRKFLFLYVVYYCSAFCLGASSTFALLDSVCDAFCHQAYFPIVHATGCKSISKFLLYLLPFLLWHKKVTTECGPSRWLQRCCFVAINT